MATRKKAARKRRTKAEPRSRGFSAPDLVAQEPPAALRELGRAVEADGGVVIGAYREPLGGHWQLFAGLPIERVEPTPHQRDVSEAHARRLGDAIERLGRFLDPVIALRTGDGRYEVPNGGHRLAALRALGARSVVALVVPEPEVAYRILLLNTEKSHNLRERSLEVIRMARGLAELDDRPEKEFADAFEEPSLPTLGLCYEANGRFAGGAYHPVLKRVEAFSGARLSKALAERELRRDRLIELDEAVNAAVAALKERGFESPYLKSYVIARANPLRFRPDAETEFEPTIAKMIATTKRFDASKVKPDQIARTGGPPAEE